MALSADSPLMRDEGDTTSYPMVASATIYEGSMVGDNGSGYARALVAGDPFRGHAVKGVVEGTAVDGGAYVRVLTGRYRMQCTLASVAVTDVGKDVYASDDATLTLTQSTNSPVGRVHAYSTTNTCVVEFYAVEGADVLQHQHTTTTDGGALTSPRVITGINDTNGNELVKVTATPSAVDELTITNGATGSPGVVTLSATGTDTDISLVLTSKGSGIVDCGATCEANAYTVGGVAGVDFSGAVTNLTTVKGIVTAAS